MLLMIYLIALTAEWRLNAAEPVSGDALPSPTATIEEAAAVSANNCHRNAGQCHFSPNITCLGTVLPYSHVSFALIPGVDSVSAAHRELDKYQVLRFSPKCWKHAQELLCNVYFAECGDAGGQGHRIELLSKNLCQLTVNSCDFYTEFDVWPNFLECEFSDIFAGKNCGRFSQHNDRRPKFQPSASKCVDPLVRTNDTEKYFDKVGGCGLKCKSPLYSHDEYDGISNWVTFLTVVGLTCFCFSVVTHVLAAFVKTGESYPEIVIFYLSISFVLICFGFAIQLLSGADKSLVQCAPDGTGAKEQGCLIVFLPVYYGFLSLLIWLIIYFYCTMVKMTDQSGGNAGKKLLKKKFMFHSSAWGIPSMSCAVISVFHLFESDGLFGICFIAKDLWTRLIAVILPLVIAVGCSSFFFLRTINAIKKFFKHTGKEKQIALKFILKFIFIYGVAFAASIIMIVNEILFILNESEWNSALKEFVKCKTKQEAMQDSIVTECQMRRRPGIALENILLVLAFFLGVGVLSNINFDRTSQIWSCAWNKMVLKRGEKDGNVEAGGKKYPGRKHEIIQKAYNKKLCEESKMSLSLPAYSAAPRNADETSNEFDSSFAAAIPRLVQRRDAVIAIDERIDLERRRNSVASLSSFASCRNSVRYRSYASLTPEEIVNLERMFPHLKKKESKRKSFMSRMKLKRRSKMSRRRSFSSNNYEDSSQSKSEVSLCSSALGFPSGMAFEMSQIQVKDKLKNLSLRDDEKKNASIQTSSPVTKTVGTQYDPRQSAVTTANSTTTNTTTSSSQTEMPLRHLEPNVIRISVDYDGESSSSYDRDVHNSTKLLIEAKKDEKENNNKNNIRANFHHRPQYNNRGRRGGIVDVSAETEIAAVELSS